MCRSTQRPCGPAYYIGDCRILRINYVYLICNNIKFSPHTKVSKFGKAMKRIRRSDTIMFHFSYTQWLLHTKQIELSKLELCLIMMESVQDTHIFSMKRWLRQSYIPQVNTLKTGDHGGFSHLCPWFVPLLIQVLLVFLS